MMLKDALIGNQKPFYEQHMLKLRPAFITDLFNGNKIRSIKTKSDAIKIWKDMVVPLDDEYDNAININQVSNQLKIRQKPDLSQDASVNKTFPSFDKKSIKFSDYFYFLEKNNYQMYSRVNFDVPDSIKQTLTIPTVCWPLETDKNLTRIKILFGCNGSFSQAHFDKDGLHGLLYQVYGRKKVILFPYTASEKMAPFTQFSGWFIQNFNDKDLKKFLTYTEGVEVILEPGEAVYIPPFYWHYVDYLTDCCSINLRFRCDKKIATLLDNFFPDKWLQGVAYKILIDSSKIELYDNIMRQLEKLKKENYYDNRDFFNLKRNLIKRIFSEIYPEVKGSYTFDLEDYFSSPLPDLFEK